MTEEKQHHVVEWTLGSSTNPNENIAISLGWLLGPPLVCALIGYLAWV